MKAFDSLPKKIHESTTCILSSYRMNGYVLPCRLWYTSADPAAATIQFKDPEGKVANWTFARDLIRSGLQEPTGIADVHITPSEDDDQTIVVALRSADGEALIFFERETLETYLDQTDAVVSPKEESTIISHRIDLELARLFIEKPSI